MEDAREETYETVTPVADDEIAIIFGIDDFFDKFKMRGREAIMSIFEDLGLKRISYTIMQEDGATAQTNPISSTQPPPYGVSLLGDVAIVTPFEVENEDPIVPDMDMVD
jgi:hypothetical protein